MLQQLQRPALFQAGPRHCNGVAPQRLAWGRGGRAIGHPHPSAKAPSETPPRLQGATATTVAVLGGLQRSFVVSISVAVSPTSRLRLGGQKESCRQGSTLPPPHHEAAPPAAFLAEPRSRWESRQSREDFSVTSPCPPAPITSAARCMVWGSTGRCIHCTAPSCRSLVRRRPSVDPSSPAVSFAPLGPLSLDHLLTLWIAHS